MKRLLWVVILMLVLNLVSAQGREKASDILELVERPVGLVHMPRGDVGLAEGIANKENHCRIHLQMIDEAAVQAARKHFDDANLVNQRVYIDRGNLERLLPAANSCDLIILIDLKDAELTEELAAEIRRVLHPWYGIALLGNANNEIDDQTLKEWGSAIGKNVENYPVQKGLVLVKAGPLEGADNWNHYWHGPDNNAVSNDKAYRYPETIQWTGKPYDATRIDLHIVANGRLFSLWNGHLMDVTFGEAVLPGEEVTFQTHGWETVMDRPLEEQRGPILVARATGSGVRLWHRRLSPAAWLQVSRSIVVAQGDRLLVGDGSSLLILDQATGREEQRIDMDCDEIKWIAATDKYIALMGGPQFSRYPERMRRMIENVTPFRSGGLLLTVLDSETLKPLWQINRVEGSDAFDPRTPAIWGDRLFVCTGKGKAEAFDIKNGEVLWSADTGIQHDKEVGFLWDRVSRHPVAGFALEGLYIIGASEMDRCAVLSQDDGKPMWELPRGRGPVPPLPLGYRDLVWFGGTARDPLTGEEKMKVPATLGGCGHFTAAPQGIVGQAGLTWDIIEGKSIPPIPAKSQCMSSQFVANGMIWRITNGVWHIPEWRGFNVRAARETMLPPATPRLVRSPDKGGTRNDPKGWTCYRANAARSSAIDIAVPEKVDVLWKMSVAENIVQDSPQGGVLLGARVMPVPPVIADNTVLVTANDGVIRAIDLKSGSSLWRAHTGGRIQSSPAIWKDHVFAGSMDGYLYAFSLEDGHELWRLRVAPETGRIMVYDQLGCRWPVLGSPLIVDGRVYAVAGLLERIDGVHALAADAVSGEIIWEQSQWTGPNGENLSSADLLGGTGQLCWDDRAQELVYSAGEGLPLRFSPDTGIPRAAYANGRLEDFADEDGKNWKVAKAFTGTHYPGGQDVGKISAAWMIKAGSRMLIDIPGKGNSYDQRAKFFAQNGDGDGLLPVLEVEGCLLTPAWDDKDALFVLEERRKPTNLALISQEKLGAFLQEEAEKNSEELEKIRRPLNINREKLFTWCVKLSGNDKPQALVLTTNAALLLISNSKTQEARLIAIDRKDGKELWHLQLPAPGIYGGLAIAQNGQAIVVLESGEVICAGKP